MKECLICNKDTTRADKYGAMREYAICGKCSSKQIIDAYDYVANKEEKELIKRLVKIENLLL